MTDRQVTPYTIIPELFDRSLLFADHVFNDLQRDFGDLVPVRNTTVANTYPRYNHYSTETEHVYEFSLPGMTEDDVKISVDEKERTLTVTGEKKVDAVENGNNKDKRKYHRREFHHRSSFTRTLRVEDDAGIEDGQVAAGYNKETSKLTVRFNRNNNKVKGSREIPLK